MKCNKLAEYQTCRRLHKATTAIMYAYHSTAVSTVPERTHLRRRSDPTAVFIELNVTYSGDWSYSLDGNVIPDT